MTFPRSLKLLVSIGLLAISFTPSVGVLADQDVPKSIFLVVEDDRVTASNVETGQFFTIDMHAKEKVIKTVVANGVAIVITNQRFAGVGAFPSGWQSMRRMAGEKIVSSEAVDYSALLVTSIRLLSFNGRTGAWAESRR